MLRLMQKNGWLLGLFAAITTAIVATTHHFTAPAIEVQKQKQVLRTLNELIAKDQYDNELYTDCTAISSPLLGPEPNNAIYRARKNNAPVAAAIEFTAPNGYNGRIHLLAVIAMDGTILGARVIKHNETPGLGDKIELRKSDWINAFANTQVASEDDILWNVKKDGGMFDQFTGATITPRATIQAIKHAALFFQQNQSEIFSLTSNCQEGK